MYQFKISSRMFSCLPYSLSQYLIEANVVHNVKRINLQSTINDLNTADLRVS